MSKNPILLKNLYKNGLVKITNNCMQTVEPMECKESIIEPCADIMD
jgi:DNA-binding protein YbaB